MALCHTANAQEIDASKNLRIWYIDHEPSLQSYKLIKAMRAQRRQQIELGHAMIVYMANGEHPYISLTGIKDNTGQGLDAPEAFDRICEALNQTSHDVLPWYDRQRIVKMFDDYNILTKDDKITFGAVRLEFYLTPESWTLGYNESIIAPIYFALNVPELLKQNFNFDIYVDPEKKGELNYNKIMPFGISNWDDINKKIVVDEYNFD